MNITKKILDNIEQKNLKPKPRWRFLVRDTLFSFLITLFIFLGGITVSVIFYIIDSNDWDIYKHLNDSLLTFTILSLPYIWLISFAILLYFSYNIWKKTKSGYKHTVWIVILCISLLTILIGSILYTSNFGAKLHFIFSDRLPIYKHLMDQRFKRWKKPNQGLLAGIATNVSSTKFTIQTPTGEWEVITTTNTIRNQIIEGERLRLLGKVTGDMKFEATQVLPWFRSKMMRKPNAHPKFFHNGQIERKKIRMRNTK